MRLTYKQRIFGYFLIIFTLFAVSIIIFERKEEKKQRTEALENKLDGYAEILHSYVNQQKLTDSNMIKIQSLVAVLPQDIRVTIINEEGKVTFDKDIKDISKLENHLNRPEVMNALYQSKGSNIRMSTSTKQEYLYYAKHYPNYYVRVALPYTLKTQSLLKADNLFVYIVVILFVVVLILLNYVSSRFGKSITQLKNLTTSIKENKFLPEKISFPEDELGEIGGQIVDIFKQKEKARRGVEIEREKLIQYFQLSHEGICIFDRDFKHVYANTHFFQYFNFISDQPNFNLEAIMTEGILDPVIEFLSRRTKDETYHTFEIKKDGKIFSIQTIVFEDESFEISIKDVTAAESTRLLKQEMTNNIAHELRTPVTSLRGYLETLNSQNLPAEKQAQFIDRAYMQSIRLSNLIDDISIISKMEEAPSLFALEKVNMSQLVNEIRIDLADKLKDNNVKLNITINETVAVNGNYTLLYSIFRNLMDNSINHVGQNVEIFINNYMEDNEYIYFTYYDTGAGLDEKHFPRLFERFYRICEGRIRDTGGSGLGLSIVKNAVLFHKGKIQVKNHAGGAGLEFLFTLKK